MKYLNKKNKKSFFIFFILVLISCFIIFIYPEMIIVSGDDKGGNYASNPNMRIGLVYDDGIVESFQTTSPKGFYFGSVKDGASDKFDVFFYINNTKISVAHIANLAKNSVGRYYASGKNIVVGKYNAEFDKTFSDFNEAYKFINGLSKTTFLNLFPAYINGKIVVRCYDFTSADSAKAFINKVSSSSPVALKVAAESNKTVVVINPDTDEILFQYEDGDNNFAAAGAVSNSLSYGQAISELSSKNTDFTASPAGNIYSGAFVYRIKNSGVEVINLISLEDYIKGVVPYEISPNWHEEALKAFSVAARTYAVFSGARHAKSGFTLCNDTHCQFYAGSKRATDATNAAVDATKDLVVTYNNKIIETVYHSSSGGATENHNDAWGGDLRFPYLTSVKVPLEKYATPGRANSLWTNTAAPRELFEYLTGASPQSSRFKDKLNSDIASIIINERSPSSNYIKSVSVVDKNGNSVTVQNSDTIRSAFGRYANSANMDIYKSFKFKSFMLPSSEKALQQDIESGKTYIITGNGLTKSTPGDGILNILTANGAYSIKAYATGNDFIFDGRGWGHGVGLSQWGMQDMAEAGYKYDAIIKTFYTGVSIDKLTNVKK
ncbi:MAG: SpoIID/LytB domain-containing protein [Oscillospiraceae bacterium]|nr:SpoIID/LytB domain-containing protein [Oscillospiraceae bacterium]